MFSQILKVFSSVFIAELGDKTQLAVLCFAASGKPLVTFLGASIALLTATAIGTCAGAAVGKFIPPRAMQVVAGSVFIILGALYIWKGIKT